MTDKRIVLTTAGSEEDDVPECVVLNIEDGSSDYLQWLTDSVQGVKK